MERQIWVVGGREEKRKGKEKRREESTVHSICVKLGKDCFLLESIPISLSQCFPDQQANQTCVISPNEVSVDD